MWWWLLINFLQFATINWGGSGRAPSDSRSLSSILKMGRSTHALLFFLLLLCSAAMAVYTKDVFGEDLGLSLEAREEYHKHSGLSQAECPGACQFRCSKTAYKKPCMFFCQKCCFKCKCVPPGTYAHKEVCPCYNNWKTKRGGPKCP